MNFTAISTAFTVHGVTLPDEIHCYDYILVSGIHQ